MKHVFIGFSKKSALISLTIPTVMVAVVLLNAMFYNEDFVSRVHERWPGLMAIAVGVVGWVVVIFPTAIRVLSYRGAELYARDGKIYFPNGLELPVSEIAEIRPYERLPGTGGIELIDRGKRRYFVETSFQAAKPRVSARKIAQDISDFVAAHR